MNLIQILEASSLYFQQLNRFLYFQKTSSTPKLKAKNNMNKKKYNHKQFVNIKLGKFSFSALCVHSFFFRFIFIFIKKREKNKEKFI